MLSRFEQNAKALVSMVVRFPAAGRSTAVRAEHMKNASCAILYTDAGIDTEVRLAHPEKHAAGICWSSSIGVSDTVVRFVQFWKSDSPKLVIDDGK